MWLPVVSVIVRNWTMDIVKLFTFCCCCFSCCCYNLFRRLSINKLLRKWWWWWRWWRLFNGLPVHRNGQFSLPVQWKGRENKKRKGNNNNELELCSILNFSLSFSLEIVLISDSFLVSSLFISFLDLESFSLEREWERISEWVSEWEIEKWRLIKTEKEQNQRTTANYLHLLSLTFRIFHHYLHLLSLSPSPFLSFEKKK